MLKTVNTSASNSVDTLDCESENKISCQLDLCNLINKINQFNFSSLPLKVALKHKVHSNVLIRSALPNPCETEIVCLEWCDDLIVDDKRISHYDLESLILLDGCKFYKIQAELLKLDEKKILLKLPQKVGPDHERAIKRFKCQDVDVHITVNSSVYIGKALEFNSETIKVSVDCTENTISCVPQIGADVTASLQVENKITYVGECIVFRTASLVNSIEFVLKIKPTSIQRHRRREFRSRRFELTPSPNVVFTHPITGTTHNLKLINLSGVGFAVSEPSSESLLVPGLVLEAVKIHLTSKTFIRCTAQVIHRRMLCNGGEALSGLAITDIDIQSHLDLLSLLQQARDQDTYVSNYVDVDSLWNFFFETGFIYPGKYKNLADNKSEIKETYFKLYQECPAIARHFTHMECGKIIGHFALLRMYEKMWVNHHHAALHHKRKSGLVVLDRMSDFVNDSYLLSSSNIKFNGGYYRSDNKFPVRFYGGFTDSIQNPKACSIDEFSYTSFQPSSNTINQLSNDWDLSLFDRSDAEELKGFYEEYSGGLLLDAIDLTPNNYFINTLTSSYLSSGFHYEIFKYALRKEGLLKAVIVIRKTDVGLNLSEITNATKIILVDKNNVSSKEFINILSVLLRKHAAESNPVMAFPHDRAAMFGLQVEKTYLLNIMSIEYWDQYMKYLHAFLKRAKVH